MFGKIWILGGWVIAAVIHRWVTASVIHRWVTASVRVVGANRQGSGGYSGAEKPVILRRWCCISRGWYASLHNPLDAVRSRPSELRPWLRLLKRLKGRWIRVSLNNRHISGACVSDLVIECIRLKVITSIMINNI